jgi:hypothetical protein
MAAQLKPVCVTPGPGSYFFGYYEKFPWSSSGRKMLACRASFEDRSPDTQDILELGVIDLADGFVFRPFAETRAWNWQQGCMLQWLDEDRVVFNDRRNGQFVGVILNLASGQERQLPRPIYTVVPGGKLAISLNFARLHRLRPGYGYAGVEEANAKIEAPDEDGVWVMDMTSGEASLIYSIAQARQDLGNNALTPGQHWFNHAQVAPGGRRMAFMHRWQTNASGAWATRLVTIDLDGRNPHSLVHHGMCSHYDWRDDQHLLAFSRAPEKGKLRDAFHLFTDQTREVSAIAPDQLDSDGHCSYSPDRRWILNDTYPDPADGCRRLMLIRVDDFYIIDIGRYYGPLPQQVENRCDLHPRWSRDGRQICIDSVHEGRRAMYTLDVSSITGS